MVATWVVQDCGNTIAGNKTVLQATSTLMESFFLAVYPPLNTTFHVIENRESS